MNSPTGWQVAHTKSGALELKMCIIHIDQHRIIEHDFIESQHRLYSVDGTTAAFEAFEELKSRWDQANSERVTKASLKGEQLSIDRFGQEYAVQGERNMIYGLVWHTFQGCPPSYQYTLLFSRVQISQSIFAENFPK